MHLPYSLLPAQALHRGTENHLEVDRVLKDCLILFENNLDFSVVFVRRQVNKVVNLTILYNFIC